MTPGVSARLRPATAEDEEHFFAVYCSTRAEELALTGWSEEQKSQFCRMQFTAQTTHYRLHHPGAEVSVIERDGRAAGRLYVDRTGKDIGVVDISLLPEHRGHGVGTQLLGALQEEARSAGKALIVHVERFNPALRLYLRLGFAVCEDQGIYLMMKWEPTPAPNAASAETAPA